MFDLFFKPFEIVREISLFEIMFRTLLSVLLGGLIGFERGMKNKAAGLRTYLLVTLGASIIMMSNQYIYQVFKTGDPVRMGAQVISGIGFLGAGSIIITAKQQIKGLTSAASLWASGAIGLAIGIGAYEIAVIGTISLYFIVEVVHRLDVVIDNRKKTYSVYLEISNTLEFEDFFKYAKKCDVEIQSIEYVQNGTAFPDSTALVVNLASHEYYSVDEVCKILRSMQGVYYLEKL